MCMVVCPETDAFEYCSSKQLCCELFCVVFDVEVEAIFGDRECLCSSESTVKETWQTNRFKTESEQWYNLCHHSIFCFRAFSGHNLCLIFPSRLRLRTYCFDFISAQAFSFVCWGERTPGHRSWCSVLPPVSGAKCLRNTSVTLT